MSMSDHLTGLAVLLLYVLFLVVSFLLIFTEIEIKWGDRVIFTFGKDDRGKKG